MSEKKIKDYLEKYPAAKRFHTKMVKYLDEYTQHNLLVESKGGNFSHHPIIHEFLAFLFNQHLIRNIDEITVSLANSKFYAKYKFHNQHDISPEEMKGILNGYFTFIYGKYGIKNERIMKGFYKKKNKNALH